MYNRSSGSSKNLSSWFLPKNKSSLDHNGPSLQKDAEREYIHKKELPKFFVPGWSADSVFSPSALSVKKALDVLTQDAKEKIIQGQNITPSLRKNIFLEFQRFTESLKIKVEITSSQHFWEEIVLQKPKFKAVEQFREIFSFRLAYLYITKLKFLLSLTEKLEISLSERNILFPNSILKRIFRPGSAYELQCECLNKNLYSWYLPSPNLGTYLNSIIGNLESLTTAQVMKLSSFNSRTPYLNFSDSSFSHTISHLEFGKLINTLCIFLPIWFEQPIFQYPQKEKVDHPEILNTLFEGDFLSSLCQSHWHAQSNNLHLEWSEILSPSFLSNKFEEGLFLKLCHELNFLIFLIRFTNKKGYQTKVMIKEVMDHRYQNDLSKQAKGQIPLFSKAHHSDEMLQERIISNVSNLPTKNAHFHLVNHILSKADQLKPNGYAIILTNQQLFLPSLSEKIKRIQGLFDFKAIFNFSELSGKGEIPKFIYILKKKVKAIKNESIPLERELKEHIDQSSFLNSSALHFKVKGELNQFRKFRLFTDALNQYIKKTPYSKVSYFQEALEQDFSFECHKDAIIDGKLLSISASYSSNITHPNFFQKLTQKCISLDSEFIITDLQKAHKQERNHFFYQNQAESKHVLVVSSHQAPISGLQVILRSELKEFKKKYGTTNYQYFSFSCKNSSLNKDLFNIFYQSNFGRQLIQLCSHTQTKGIGLKSLVGTLLFPSFLLPSPTERRTQDISLCSLLEMSSKDIECFKLDLEESISQYKTNLFHYPESVLSQFVALFIESSKELSDLHDFSSENYLEQFRNHHFISKLVHLKKHPVFPNDDLFIQLECEQAQLSQKITSFKKETSESGLKLTLFSENVPMAHFYATNILIEFVIFILSSVEQPSLIQLINHLQIPSSQELKKISHELTFKFKKLSELKLKLEHTLKESMIELIMN